MNARLAVAACLVLSACTENDKPVTPPANPAPAVKVEGLEPARKQHLVEAGPLKDDVITFEFAVYFLGPVPKNLDATATKLAKKLAPNVRIAKTQEADERGPAMHFSTPPIDSYAPPSADNLKYFARGLSAAELAKVPNATGAFLIDAVAPGDQADETQRAVLALIHGLAVQWKGVLWDEETRQVFSTKHWAEHRLAWKSGLANLSDHVTMHQYANGELFRVITLGMRKFGLPDVVANDVSSASGPAVAHLVNLVTQTLYEHPELATEGTLSVDVTALENAAARDEQTTGLFENAKKKATLTLAWAEPEKGDPKNRLLEIVFAGAGESAQEGQHRVTTEVYGNKDSLFKVDNGDAELQAAHARALAAFLKLKKSFKPKKGVQLMAKAPFTTDTGGTEWMWVDVTEWRGTKVRGILANEPYEVSNLKVGARVEFDESSVFDYQLTKADGTTEGNETDAIIERMERR